MRSQALFPFRQREALGEGRVSPNFVVDRRYRMQVYTKRTVGAFGGLFADHSRVQASPQASGALPNRVRDQMKGAVRTHEECTLRQSEPDDRRAEQ